MDQVRQRTKQTVPVETKELIAELNPLLRGWGSTTNELTSEDSSTVSIVGSFVVSGRTAPSTGVMPVGSGYHRGCSTMNTGLSTSLS